MINITEYTTDLYAGCASKFTFSLVVVRGGVVVEVAAAVVFVEAVIVDTRRRHSLLSFV